MRSRIPATRPRIDLLCLGWSLALLVLAGCRQDPVVMEKLVWQGAVERDGLTYTYYRADPVGHTMWGPRHYVIVTGGEEPRRLSWGDADQILGIVGPPLQNSMWEGGIGSGGRDAASPDDPRPWLDAHGPVDEQSAGDEGSGSGQP